MDDTPALETEAASGAEKPLPAPRPRGVPLRQVWRWIAPGVWGIALAFIFLFGLVSASKAPDRGTEVVGFALAGCALIGIAWMLRAQSAGALPSLMISDGASLVVLAGVLIALAIGGLVLAARGQGATLPSTGYSMFLVSIGMIYYNLRHYFDVREKSRQDRDEAKPASEWRGVHDTPTRRGGDSEFSPGEDD